MREGWKEGGMQEGGRHRRGGREEPMRESVS